MNAWMMCGDWAPMPMNVRDAKQPPFSEPVKVELPPPVGKHYDVIIYDDVVHEPTKINLDRYKQILQDLEIDSRKFAQECHGVPMPPAKTATEVSMQLLERERREEEAYLNRKTFWEREAARVFHYGNR